MELAGWGRFPRAQVQLSAPQDTPAVLDLLADTGDDCIARGLGRSYGDSSLAPRVLSARHLDQFSRFDQESGELTCAAGVSLSEIIDCFLPRGWFPAVVPGTRYVTVGGAIASDVHGKNHHQAGSFSDHLESLQIATPGEGVLSCSRDRHPELFRATCGGMGLTGVILAATLRLRRVAGAAMDETTWQARNLGEALELFGRHDQATYSVAWIDCAARGRSLGRSVLRLGEHAPGDLVGARPDPGTPLSVPLDMPGFLLNRYSIGAFNALYYRRAGNARSRRVSLYPYFFPLDAIAHWNRLYGRKGFLQYQCVLPLEGGAEGMECLLERISASRHGSFLAVLKAFGKGNRNYLSFPMAGYTLALDFRMARGLLPFLEELDRIVLDHGGRLYLAKDARMSESVFKQSYPQWEAFAAVRSRYGADRVIHSMQSRRLGI